MKLNANKIKTVKRNSPYAFVCFRTGEDRENALKVLSNYKWKGKLLEAVVCHFTIQYFIIRYKFKLIDPNLQKAKPAPDPLVKKRQEDAEDGGVNKKLKTDVESKDKLKSSTIPYWNIEYDEQVNT